MVFNKFWSITSVKNSSGGGVILIAAAIGGVIALVLGVYLFRKYAFDDGKSRKIVDIPSGPDQTLILKSAVPHHTPSKPSSEVQRANNGSHSSNGKKASSHSKKHAKHDRGVVEKV